MKSLRWQDHKLAFVAFGALLLAIVTAYFFPMLTTDTCCRYAPMAEAFAAGDWGRAFHPRFCLGMPVVAGTFRFLTGADGYTSCTIVASVAWAVGIVPLFLLTRRVFDEQTAWFAVVLYLVGPAILPWGLMGLREPFKVLGILLMTDAVFGCRDGGWRNFGEASAGLALLVFFKVDAVVYGFLLTYVYMRVDWFKVRSWVLFAELILVLQPCCWLVYEWTGAWIPVLQYAPVFKRMFGG